MELSDGPPGAEGYQDSVTEVPKKPDQDSSCTKAEQEFQDHLNSLKIKIEDDSYRCMVERRGRDISGKWIYLCYPCAAVCSGEAILQTHISGKKHKAKLSVRNVWPMSIFTDHPYNQSETGHKVVATPKVLKKMAEEVELYNASSDLDVKYARLKEVRCHIQDTLDDVTAPLIGVEYLVEHPPQEAHYEPSYTCTLCYKQGHPRTIVNHMTCFWHRHNYLQRHFPKAADLLKPFRQQLKYRDGVAFIMNRIAQRIVEKYGRMKPINIDKEDYEKDKERIHQWIFKGPHHAETKNCTFEEVVDIDLINTLYKSSSHKAGKDPSPPIVAVPKPNNSNRPPVRRERRISMESLSDLSDELERYVDRSPKGIRYKRAPPTGLKARYEPYPDKARDAAALRNKYAAISAARKALAKSGDSKRQPNYEYKMQMAADRRAAAEEAAGKSLAYHEKNPEKHPLYPEEWKKFWNRRYKEIQAEGKDPSKHDFKPEWIVFWTGRMKELHKEELRLQVVEIYRKMCLTPPPAHLPPPPDKRRKSLDGKDSKRSPEARRRSPPPFRPADARRRTPEPRRRSPHYRRERSPVPHHRGPPPPRRHSPPRGMRSRSQSPVHGPPRTHNPLESRGSRSPLSRRETSHRNRSPVPRIRSPGPRIRSPTRRSRSPACRSRSPARRSRSPVRRSRSPTARRARSPMPGNRSPVPRNRSPAPRNRSPAPRNRSPATRHRSPEFSRRGAPRHHSSRNRSPNAAPLNTVLISDDELKADDAASLWNSDNSLESLGSLPDARSPPSPPRHAASAVAAGAGGSAGDGADNVVATLRTLVALEDYLGSLGPKIVDLLAEAIKMEKDKANSSEELLERDTAVVLIETAKEKLKGAAQAGLVAPAAAAAVRAAVVRAAATLHEADKRARLLKAESGKKAAASGAGVAGGTSGAAVPVAGVGAVDRVQIAQQMAAALVAQGKTDVSEEELAQLVEAVVGMAEAKKREADGKKQTAGRAAGGGKGGAPAASALQMLQSAYDDKKCEKEDAPDAMDGLSDSDLETLLKNFNELSAEEQHSLIAYLKKLEAREPQRVERLRQYVSAAAARAPARAPPAAADPHLVPVDSDDDDYTVEEVFKSATEKVKEDEIRQEMEIVKKSLEESKVTAAEVATAASYAPVTSANINLSSTLSSAADLLALVQASLQSANTPVQAVLQSVADVVTSNTQLRSFGDKPDAGNPAAPINSQPSYVDRPQNQPPFKQQGRLRVAQNLTYANTPSAPVDPRASGSAPTMNNEQSRFGVNYSNTNNEPRFGANNPNTNNEQRFGTNNPNTNNEPRFGVNNPNNNNEPRFGANNPNNNNEPRFGANNPNNNNELRFGANNANIKNEPYFGVDNPNTKNEPRFEVNNPNTNNEPLFAANISNIKSEPYFGANNPNTNNEPLFGAVNPNTNNEPRFGANNANSNFGANNPNLNHESRYVANNSNTNNEPRFGGNNPNTSNDSRLGGSYPNTHGEQGYSNNQAVHNEPRFGGNNTRIHNEPAYGGGNPNVYKAPQWEPRHVSNAAVEPQREQGFTNFKQENSYKPGDRGPQDMYMQRPQAGYNKLNSGRMPENYDARTQNINQPHFGNRGNHRGRGNFGNRGRGRGRGAW